MKRIKIFVIVFAALCTLTACGAQQEQTVARNLYAVHLLPDAGRRAEKCKADKQELIPADGWILPEETLEFYEGESVFDVLLPGDEKSQNSHGIQRNAALSGRLYRGHRATSTSLTRAKRPAGCTA